jgi:cell division protein FtsB
MALYSVGPLQTYLAQRDRLAELERQTRVLQEQTRELRGRIRRLHDPGYLERVARECLGMVRPGEIAFIVVGEGRRGATRAC